MTALCFLSCSVRRLGTLQLTASFLRLRIRARGNADHGESKSRGKLLERMERTIRTIRRTSGVLFFEKITRAEILRDFLD